MLCFETADALAQSYFMVHVVQKYVDTNRGNPLFAKTIYSLLKDFASVQEAGKDLNLSPDRYFIPQSFLDRRSHTEIDAHR